MTTVTSIEKVGVVTEIEFDCLDHQLRGHWDLCEPWCDNCGKDRHGNMTKSRLFTKLINKEKNVK